MRKTAPYFLPVLGLLVLVLLFLARPNSPVRELPSAPVRVREPAPVAKDPADLPTPTPQGSKADGTESRVRELLSALGAAIKTGSVWKSEIKSLLQLEDLAFRSTDAGLLKQLLLKTLTDPESGRDLAGLVTFVLTADPTDQGRKELAGLLGKSKGNDASIVYAVLIRNARIDKDMTAREAFWRGCLAFTEREGLLTLGFRDRLFKEEYGKSVEEVRRTELVKPSGADRFESQAIQPFHELQKKGFSMAIGEEDAVRDMMVDYLRKGNSPEAKLAVCVNSKPGPDLALAAREAFQNSFSYPDAARRWLLNRAQGEGSRSGWEVLYDLLPFAGDLKPEMLQRMVSAAGESPDRQARTLEFLRKEINQSADSGERIETFVKGVAGLRTEDAQTYLLDLCRKHPDEALRAAAAGVLYPDNPGKVDAAQIQKRVACAEEALLQDPSAKVKASAVYSLAWLLSDRGKISSPGQVRAQVQALVAGGQVSERTARPVLEALNQQR